MNAVRRQLAEYLGTALIVATVLGAGHMVTVLNAQPALGLLMIAICVGAVLFGAISALAPISGAHFNPLVSLAFFISRELGVRDLVGYVIAQILGALSGAAIANLMFDKAAFTVSSVDRVGTGVFIGEVLATFGLVLLILLLARSSAHLIPAAVAIWIVAGHIFTSSTSFANPAVSLGRMLSDAPSSISPVSMPGYLIAQLIGFALALLVANLLQNKKPENA